MVYGRGTTTAALVDALADEWPWSAIDLSRRASALLGGRGSARSDATIPSRCGPGGNGRCSLTRPRASPPPGAGFLMLMIEGSGP